MLINSFQMGGLRVYMMEPRDGPDDDDEEERYGRGGGYGRFGIW